VGGPAWSCGGGGGGGLTFIGNQVGAFHHSFVKTMYRMGGFLT
jgi:hypothetical protein